MELHINKSAPSCQQNLLAKQDEILNKIGAIPSKVVQHLQNFMEKAQLFPRSGRAFVAVSSGLDSMFLLNMLWRLKAQGKLKELTVLHVNHGTRPETQKEEEFLRDYAATLDLPFKVKRLSLNSKSSNFEDEARKKRYAFFETFLKTGDKLYLGHHIDDSLEWSLLCTFKSGELKGRLGIPLIRGPIARPLFCFSRKQIERFMKEARLPYYEDASNQNTKYERNYLRGKLLPQVKERFPSYLKHYVRQSNALAQKLGFSRFGKAATCSVLELSDCTILRRAEGGDDFPEDMIKASIFRHSSEGRGRIGDQLRKLKEAVKGQKWGPLSFSGGVEVHIRPGYLYIMKGHSQALRRLDEAMLKILKQQITAQIPLDFNFSQKESLNLLNSDCLPYLFSLSKQERGWKFQTLKRIDPLFPKSTAYALESQIWFYYLVKARQDKNILKRPASFCTIQAKSVTNL